MAVDEDSGQSRTASPTASAWANKGGILSICDKYQSLICWSNLHFSIHQLQFNSSTFLCNKRQLRLYLCNCRRKKLRYNIQHMVHITIRTYTRNGNRDTALSTSDINGIIYNVKQLCFVVCLLLFFCFFVVVVFCCFFLFFCCCFLWG